MVQALAKQAAKESFVQRGDGSVIPYAEFCEIVGAINHKFQDDVDLTEGQVGEDGIFVPRHWGWGRKDLKLFDSYLGRQTARRTGKVIRLTEPLSVMEQRAAEFAEHAKEMTAFNS